MTFVHMLMRVEVPHSRVSPVEDSVPLLDCHSKRSTLHLIPHAGHHMTIVDGDVKVKVCRFSPYDSRVMFTSVAVVQSVKLLTFQVPSFKLRSRGCPSAISFNMAGMVAQS